MNGGTSSGSGIMPGERRDEQRPGYNHLGQKIGSKGERTRRLLIEAVLELLRSKSLRDVSVIDVARRVGTSPATFYVYFRGVPEAVLAALEGIRQTCPEMEELLAGDWLSGEAALSARRVIELYTQFWDRNSTIFRVRNLAAEEGDIRFYQARVFAAEPVLLLLASAVERAQAAGKVPADLEPRACAATLLMMLERLCAIGPMSPDADGLTFPAIKAAAAHTLAAMLGGTGAGPD